jgi:L-alanine-DL-glutamate epimerase-like enolase superfamily enzyme
VYAGLAATGGVAIVDFKGGGTVLDHARAGRALPEALLEDPGPPRGPWPADVRRRLALDAAIQRAADVDGLAVRPAAINVKPGRLGGVLEALATCAACERAGIPVYVGGMFEVGVGRRQLHDLAALLSPDGPNDVAPIAVGDARAARPPRLSVDPGAAGFGRTLDSAAPTA